MVASFAWAVGRPRSGACSSWVSCVARRSRLRRAAPLGDPLEYVVKGYHLSLRRREAATITVEALDSANLPPADEAAEEPAA